MPSMSQHLNRNSDQVAPLTPTPPTRLHRTSRAASDAPTVSKEDERVSCVRVLNTSLPFVHEDILEQRHKAQTAGEDPDLTPYITQTTNPDGESTDPQSPSIPEQKIDPSTNKLVERPKEEQEATSRALKPHARIGKVINQGRQRDRPEGMTPVPEKAVPSSSKPKARKWQFGIRSRNAPSEAMKCLYSALEAQRAVWEIFPAPAKEAEGHGENAQDGGMPLSWDGTQHVILQSRYPSLPSDYYIPRDPWFIRARMLKRGMFAPGSVSTYSATNSVVNLGSEHNFRQKVEEMGGYLSNDFQHLSRHDDPDGIGSTSSRQNSQPTSAHTTRPSSATSENPGPTSGATGTTHVTHPGRPSHFLSRPGSVASGVGREPNPNIGVWVFIDIQLYSLETNTFMVDFKCDGYQNVRLEPASSNNANDAAPSSSKWASTSTASNSRAGSRITSPNHSRPTSGFDSHHTSSVPHNHHHQHQHQHQPTSSTSSPSHIDPIQPSARTSSEIYAASSSSTAASPSPPTTTKTTTRPHWVPCSKRFKNKEKEVTSPYPYLDVASDLIAQLAVAN